MADRIEGSLTAAMEQERKAMTMMSKRLLSKLWEQHRYQMLFAMEQGRKVERP